MARILIIIMTNKFDITHYLRERVDEVHS